MRPADTVANFEMCMCPQCPTHNDCMKAGNQALFCAKGATECNPSSHGCICDECAVWAENELSGYYYCMDGAAE